MDMTCQSCGGSMPPDGLILITVITDGENESVLLCSPDCFIDKTADLVTRMRRQKESS